MAMLQHNDTGLFYEVSGSGPPVVLGHSFLCSGAMWEPQIGPLSENHQVINIDLRGHGRSEIATRPFTIYDLVDDVLAVLDHLGIERPVWAGLSIGGMVALRAALVARHRVAGLILLGTHAGRESSAKKIQYQAMLIAAKLMGVRSLAPRISRMFFGPHTQKNQPDLVAAWISRFASVPLSSIGFGLAALKNRESIVDRLGEIEVPTLVIVGEDDTPLPPACSREIAAGIKGSSLVEIPDCGHLSTLEQPDIVTSAMLAHLLPPGGHDETPAQEGMP